jgi:hypothetical protein
VLVVAIVLLGGATAAAIVLTKHGRHVTETVTAPSPEAEESSESASREEPEYEEESSYEEEPGHAEEEREEGEEGGGTEASASAAQVAQNQIQDALRAHFHRLAYGNYDAAFRDLTTSEQESAGGPSGWTEGQEEDGLESFSLSVETSLLDPHSARADIVDFQTHSIATGCNYWSGYWEMSKVYGEWLINKAKLEREPC